MPVGAVVPKGEFGSMNLSEDHRAYLKKRGILKASLKTGVQTIMGRQGQPLIWFPYPREWGKTYDLSDASPWSQRKPKNARLPLWNIENVNFSRPWLLTEGEFDALSAIEVDFDNTASLPEGAVQPDEEFPAKSGKLRSIREAWPQIQAGGAPVILALDNDAAGEATKAVLIDLFGRWRCHTVAYPKHARATGDNGECKDLNEILQLCGRQELARVLREAKPLKLEGVFKPSEIPKRPKRVYYSTGIEGMDEHIKLFPGELCIWSGHTSHGKSTSLFNVLGNLAKEGLRIGLASFEAEYWEDILPFYEVWLHGADNLSEQTAKDAHAWMDERFTLISHEIEPLQAPASIEWVIRQAQDAKGRFGIDVLVIDPWNKLQHKRRAYENETDYIGRALAELRNFAQAYYCIVIVAAHPTKESGKEGEVPTEFDIHGSMNWGNAADHIIITYRPDKKLTCTRLDCRKSRYKGGGVPGHKWFTFSSSTNKYSPMAPHMIEELEKKTQAKKRKSKNA